MVRWWLALAVVLLLVPWGGAQWSEYRHDGGNTGIADEHGGILASHLRFSFTANGAVVSSPAVAEVAGERLAFFGSYVALSTAGTVYAVQSDGSLAWSTTPLGSTGGYLSSPAVAELGDGGAPEVVIASLDDSTLRVFDAETGAQEWAVAMGTTGTDLLAGSPAVADLLPGVQGLEIAMGGSKSGHDGSLVIYDRRGNERWSHELDGPSWSKALVRDLDGDGVLEMALATGVPSTLEVLFPAAKTGGGSIYVFEQAGSTWQVRWSDRLSGASLAAPTAADLDGDGDLELVIGAEGGQIRVYDAASGTRLATSGGWSDTVGLSSAAVGDVDGDGEPEIVAGGVDGVFALTWRSGRLVEDHRIVLPQVPAGAGSVDPWVGASVALADVDGDGDLEVAASTLPINVDPQDILNSDALPGKLFVFHGEDFRYPEGLLFEMDYANDGTISGPVIADMDGDGFAEVLAGEGVPVIGDGKALHVVAAANPIVRSISVHPPSPMALVEAAFSADVVDEDHAAGQLTYAWDFGDGATSRQRAPVHTYNVHGPVTARLTVSDPDGNQWTVELPRNVRPFRDFSMQTNDVPIDAAPGQELVLEAVLSNTGPLVDTYHFTSPSTAWQPRPPQPVTLQPGEERSVALRVTVPEGAAGEAPLLEARVSADRLVERQAEWDVRIPVLLAVEVEQRRTPWLAALDPFSSARAASGTVTATFADGQPVADLSVAVSQTPRPFTDLYNVRAVLATETEVRTDADGVARFILDDPQAALPGDHVILAQTQRDGSRYWSYAVYTVTLWPPV